MAGLTVSHAEALGAFSSSVESFRDSVGSVSERELLGSSLCHGWSRMDVAAHVLAGWHEMLGGFLAPSDADPDVDAATYWTAFAAQTATTDPVHLLMAQRRRTDAYSRPSSLVSQISDVAATVISAAQGLRRGSLHFQGHVLSSGDFLTTWAVENAIHQLDLSLMLPVPAGALRLARYTCDALLPLPLPATWGDAEAVLVACGRVHREDVPESIADLLPVI